MTNERNNPPDPAVADAAIRGIAATLQSQTATVAAIRDTYIDSRHAGAVAATFGEDPHDLDTTITQFGQLADTNWWAIVREALEAAEAEYITIAGRWFRVLVLGLDDDGAPLATTETALAGRWNAAGDIAAAATERMKVYAIRWEALRAQIAHAPVNRDSGAPESIRVLAVEAVAVAQASVKDMANRVRAAHYAFSG